MKSLNFFTVILDLKSLKYFYISWIDLGQSKKKFRNVFMVAQKQKSLNVLYFMETDLSY